MISSFEMGVLQSKNNEVVTNCDQFMESLEQKYDSQFKMVFDAIRQLMTPPEPKKKKAIGFGRE